MHEAPRDKLCGNYDKREVIRRLIDVLKDANIEDMDLAKVAAKALHNLAALNQIWKSEDLKRLDEILTNLGEELDSIMVRLIDNQNNENLQDVANDEELEEIKGLRELVNALINDMPEMSFDCPDVKCGRKFKNQEELDKHRERRH